MDRALVQQAIDGIPITEFEGVQKPSAGSTRIQPTKEHIFDVIKKLLDPQWRRQGLLRIAQKTPNPDGYTMSLAQVKIIAQMVDAKITELRASEIEYKPVE